MPQTYRIEVTTGPTDNPTHLLTTVKSQYESEYALVASLAHKIHDSRVSHIEFTKQDGGTETNVKLVLASGDRDVAHLVIYGEDYATGDTDPSRSTA